MTIAHFGFARSHSENGSAAGPETWTPPSSMVAGQLVCLWVQYRNGSEFRELEIAVTGGQNWKTEEFILGANLQGKWIHCQFNGTWAADPEFRVVILDGGGGDDTTLALTVVGDVFDEPAGLSGTGFWMAHRMSRPATFAAGTTPFTKTITGLTTTKNNAIVMAAWGSQDDNTWDTLSGTGWDQTGMSPIYTRNQQGSDMSCALAYKDMPTAGAVGDVSLNQVANAGDAGIVSTIAFAYVTKPTVPTGGGAMSLVQTARAQDPDDGAAWDCVFGSPVASGNGVVLMVTHENGFINSVIDNQGNEYYPVAHHSVTLYQQDIWIYWRPGITNGPDTITVTLNTTGVLFGKVISAHEVANLGDFVGAFSEYFFPDPDVEFNLQMATITPPGNGAYFFGGASLPGEITGFDDKINNVDSPWTARIDEVTGGDPTVDWYSRTYDQVQGAAAAEGLGMTVAATVPHILAAYAVFKPQEAAAGAGFTQKCVTVLMGDP